MLWHAVHVCTLLKLQLYYYYNNPRADGEGTNSARLIISGYVKICAKLSSILFMSWTVFDVMCTHECKFCLSNCFSFWNDVFCCFTAIFCFKFRKKVYSTTNSSILTGNKTLYGALTRWGYTNTHIAVYDTYRLQYTATVFQLRFKVVPELGGKVKYERERLNTVQ
jgi:hypothetical protein